MEIDVKPSTPNRWRQAGKWGAGIALAGIAVGSVAYLFHDHSMREDDIQPAPQPIIGRTAELPLGQHHRE